MRNLGNIKIAVLSDRYSVQFKYATPHKIDFFALTLMEIIKHSSKFSKMIIEEVLLKMDIPHDLFNIFEERLQELVENSPEIISFDDSIEDADNISIWNEVEYFSLTEIGEEAYRSKEIAEAPQNLAREYVYETANGKLSQTNKVTLQDEAEAISIDMQMPSENNAQDIFTHLISENPQKYIADASSKTKIFELSSAPSGTIGIRDNIAVLMENGKLKFENSNEKILKAFLNVSQENKNEIRKKMFDYLNMPHTAVNFERAALAIKRQQPIKMKAVFGKKEAIEAVAETDFKIELKTDDYAFAGITENGKTLVYNYCELTEQGYTIPIEELDYSEQNYSTIFKKVFEMYKNNIENVKFIILATPETQKETVIKSMIVQVQDIESVLAKTKIIIGLNIIKKERIIRILAENAPKTDKIINALLAIDESATIQIYELVKLYNSLLKSGKMSDISHNTNLYSTFADYDRQYKKLQTIGLKNYYEYAIPEDWDAFMKEVYILKSMFDKIKKQLDGDIVKQASDFFIKVEDDYYALAPIDEKSIKKLIDGDLESAINSPNFDASLIASAIRSKYEEALRSAERVKDPKANTDRKGKELIRYAVEPKNVDEVHKHWRNLNKLVHKATELEDPLWKGNDEDRRRALRHALTCYNQKFAAKENKK